MSANIQIKGLERFKSDLERADFARRKDILVEAALEGVEIIREEASNLAPRDTGTLSENIIKQEDKSGSDINGVTVKVGPSNEAFYGFFQEYGTAHNPPQAFLGPAIDSNISQVEDRIADALSKALGKM